MRKIIVIFSCCIVLLLVGFAGYRSYQVWREGHWLALARKFAATSDVRNELLSLNQVLHSNPQNLEACRMMANLAETAHNPSAVVWRQRILAQKPDSLEDRLALVQTAVYFKDYVVATNVIAGVDDAGRKTAMYNSIAGTLALVLGQVSNAETYFSQATQLEPTNLVAQVDLAVVRLHGSNELDMADARIALQRVIMTSTDPTLLAQARRELVLDAMHTKDHATALTLSKQLAEQPNALFTDRLLRLNVLLDTSNSGFDEALAAYRKEAESDPSKLAEIVNWQVNRLSPGQTLAWMQSLPPQVRTNQPTALLVAECRRMTGDWIGLQRSLQNQNWGDWEYARHAYLALSLREQGLDGASQIEWDLARNTANPDKERSSLTSETNLRKLFLLTTTWKWQSESEQILWTVVNQFPDDQSAAMMLAQDLVLNGRTRSLMELFSIQSRRNPSNLAFKNNLAMVAMLLGADEVKPYDLSREVYQKDPTNSDYASTYAFTLYRQGKTAEALEVLRQLKPEELQSPAIAGYYGLILKADGDSSKAKAYLDLSMKGKLLPEERKLFQDAAASL
jgi:tetratricopeptide (TPR) repeat protein